MDNPLLPSWPASAAGASADTRAVAASSHGLPPTPAGFGSIGPAAYFSVPSLSVVYTAFSSTPGRRVAS